MKSVHHFMKFVHNSQWDRLLDNPKKICVLVSDEIKSSSGHTHLSKLHELM